MSCRVLLIAALAAATAGCMSFNGAELPRREGPLDLPNPPVVSLEINEVKVLRNGLPSDESAQSIADQQLASTLRIWKSRGLIKEWGRRSELGDLPAYTLALTGSANEEASTLRAYITGATLYLVPQSIKWTYEWQFALTDMRDGTVYRVPIERTSTTWLHALFLPALPFARLGLYNGDRDQALYLYTELEKQGAWSEYAPTEMAAPRAIEPEHD